MVKTLKLQSKKYVSPKRVYDLEIKDNHNFFANNILIHNCYQEQIMQIANKIGGFDASETNILRKTLVKAGKNKDTDFQKKLDKQRQHFIENASQYLGSEQEAEEMWKLMESFSAYGFNRSHSVSYTYVSFREYWLKAHYDPEFNVALLNNTPLQKEKKGESVIAQYVTEMAKKGFTVHRPDINTSEAKFTLKNNSEILWGLQWIKNISDKIIFDIITERGLNGKFTNIDEFYARIEKINKKDVEALVWSGALDTLLNDELKTRFDLYNYIFETIRRTKKFEPLSFNENTLIEKEIEYISVSFLEVERFIQIRKIWSEQTGIDVNNLYEAEDEGQYTCIGMIDRVENKKTKTGKDYKRITLRDETKILKNIYVWPWKCRGWEGLKKGYLIQAGIVNDGNFLNLMSWSKIEEYGVEEEIDEEEVEKKENHKKFLEIFRTIHDRWKQHFTVERTIDEVTSRPSLKISSQYGKMNILVYNYDEEKGIPRKDLVQMKDHYDAIYIVNGSEYLFDMRVFQDKMSKLKSRNRHKHPIIPSDIEHQLPEDVIINKLS